MEPQWSPAAFSRPHADGIECTLCPFQCVLHDNEIGRCRVRRRYGTQLESATFATSVRHVQPIERKPLYHFRPGARVLTLAAPGCTFACTYCQNYRISQFGRSAAATWNAEPVVPDEVVENASRERLCIAFSYSEPVLAAELTLALAPRAAAQGVPLLWKTNGFITRSALREVAPVLAAVNVDLKVVDEHSHRRLTAAPVAPVLDAIAEFKRAGVWLEISTPILSGVNDTDSALAELARAVRAFGADVPWHLLRTHPDYRMGALTPTHPDTLARARAIAHAEGIHYVYVERALGAEGRTTHCPSCGIAAVQRGIWSFESHTLNHGACTQCGTAIAGHW